MIMIFMATTMPITMVNINTLAIILILAVALDLLIGDPERITHPVVYMGKLINWLEEIFHPGVEKPVLAFLAGLITTILVVGSSYLTVFYLLKLAFWMHYWVGIAVAGWLFGTTIATTSLKKAALAIYHPLTAKDLPQAREYLSYVVGRDTAGLDEGEVSRGAVETVAENTVDGVIAPLFYGIIGGPALAMAYKAVNTLDSMIGYKNQHYLYFGRFAAKLDDIANYIPARLTGFAMVLIAPMLGKQGKASIVSWRKYAHLHPSPNGGIPEAVVAGALGIRLGGYNWYFGQKQFRAYMGDDLRPIDANDIMASVRMMYGSTAMFLALVLSGMWLASLIL